MRWTIQQWLWSNQIKSGFSFCYSGTPQQALVVKSVGWSAILWAFNIIWCLNIKLLDLERWNILQTIPKLLPILSCINFINWGGNPMWPDPSLPWRLSPPHSLVQEHLWKSNIQVSLPSLPFIKITIVFIPHICSTRTSLEVPYAGPEHSSWIKKADYYPQCRSSCRPLVSLSLARSFTGRPILLSYSPLHHQLNSAGCYYHRRHYHHRCCRRHRGHQHYLDLISNSALKPINCLVAITIIIIMTTIITFIIVLLWLKVFS